MKLALAFPAFACLVAVNALTSCQLTCAESSAASACTTTNYNDTSCGCDATFESAVKACLYQTSGCSGDVSSWYSYLDTACADATTASSTEASAAASSAAASGASASSASHTGYASSVSASASGSAAASGAASSAAATSAAASAAASSAASSSASIVGVPGISVALMGLMAGAAALL